MSDFVVTVTLIKTVKNVADENAALEKVQSIIPEYIRKQFVSGVEVIEVMPSTLIKSENHEPG